MKIGVPKEIKNHEYRVGLTPESVFELSARGHEVLVETAAGIGIGKVDADYQAAGAKILESAEDVFAQATMIIKVKEPQAVERKLLNESHILYTYLHLAPDPEQTADLVQSAATCIAYETVDDAIGGLPLLKPMSQVAGRLSIQAGAMGLEKNYGGSGLLLGGVPGVAPAKVLIIGGGVVGFNAACMAVGLQADVTILDRNPAVLESLSNYFGSRAKVVYADQMTIEKYLKISDLVVGAVLVPGASAPKLVSREMLGLMQPGSCVVDVAIDQGGCFETSKATTHQDPTYIVDGIVHYCVANMPGIVPKTSTYALNIATLRHAIAIAERGWQTAVQNDHHLRNGLNVVAGKVTCEAVAMQLGYEYHPVEQFLA